MRTSANPTGYAHRMAINAANSWFRRRGPEQRARERSRARRPVPCEAEVEELRTTVVEPLRTAFAAAEHAEDLAAAERDLRTLIAELRDGRTDRER